MRRGGREEGEGEGEGEGAGRGMGYLHSRVVEVKREWTKCCCRTSDTQFTHSCSIEFT